MNNEFENNNSCYSGNILNNALEEMRNRRNCCPRFIQGPTGPTGPTERLFKSSNRIIIDSS